MFNPSWSALVAMLILPKVLAFGELIVYVPDEWAADTVLEVPLMDSDQPTIYTSGDSFKDVFKGATDKQFTGPDDEEREYSLIYTETFEAPTAYRPLILRRGTKDEDGGHVTECEVSVGDTGEKAIASDGISTYDLGFELHWFLGAGHTFDSTAELNTSCSGEEYGIRWPRE